VRLLPPEASGLGRPARAELGDALALVGIALGRCEEPVDQRERACEVLACAEHERMVGRGVGREDEGGREARARGSSWCSARTFVCSARRTSPSFMVPKE
jgi:hypothetical protein